MRHIAYGEINEAIPIIIVYDFHIVVFVARAGIIPHQHSSLEYSFRSTASPYLRYCAEPHSSKNLGDHKDPIDWTDSLNILSYNNEVLDLC